MRWGSISSVRRPHLDCFWSGGKISSQIGGAAHCDGPYYYETEKTEFQTHYTLQLYLNDSAEEDSSTGEEELVGGATGFLSRDKTRRVDVNPKAGSVLIFQHEGLLHEGAEVKKGVKYTMRTDILYEWVLDSPAGK